MFGVAPWALDDLPQSYYRDLVDYYVQAKNLKPDRGEPVIVEDD